MLNQGRNLPGEKHSFFSRPGGIEQVTIALVKPAERIPTRLSWRRNWSGIAAGELQPTDTYLRLVPSRLRVIAVRALRNEDHGMMSHSAVELAPPDQRAADM